MLYLNCVCNEVLRLFPTIPIIMRVAIRDTTVEGHHIPVGTTIYIVPCQEFVPECWIHKETGRPTMRGGAESNYSFLTFSHGPKKLYCWRARWKKVVAGGTITSKPVNGMRLKLQPVEWGSG
ncbi:hypothetical protein COCCADRAFT_41484 [Bipolaris zeicola 26-R-13]|uniref:Cytochrome P450 n=1 Tax=Cochliobolus carbonum (strain 26-R-13) TaxID=930089 RepID=W6Y9T3_COCC2|nr:uncharacterized protein COCCADRAFT_41484 [Bipolaris zeicola 26-R-13]EUC27906.1 hypothetical protein COCCADRAFT_41484 [Bipolaris zeicola 26-R-13]